MPASSSARSRSLPAGPTNGWPARSSASPGCSPTIMTSALRGPSQKTVCVPRLYRSQARQSFAASLTAINVGRWGINSGTGGPSPPASGSLRRFGRRTSGGFLVMFLLERPADVFSDQRVGARRLVDVTERGQCIGVTRRAGADSDIAPQTPDAGARHRGAFERPPELDVSGAPQFRKRAAVERCARQPRSCAVFRRGGLGVPGANLLADVAAVRVTIQRAAMRNRNRVLQLDRQIRKAPRRIEHVRLD